MAFPSHRPAGRACDAPARAIARVAGVLWGAWVLVGCGEAEAPRPASSLRRDGVGVVAGSRRDEAVPTPAVAPPEIARPAGPVAPPSPARGPVAPDASEALARYPALRASPPPRWVKPGARITYATTKRAPAAASTPRLDDAGEWVGADGRRLPEAGDSTERGVAQMTVVALTPSHAVLSITHWRRGSDGNLAFDDETCAVGVPGSAGEVWIDPAVLAGAERSPPSGVRVVRRPYDAGAKRHDAVWFLAEGERADRVSVYDAESGVLVHRAAIEAADTDGRPRLVGATLVGVRDATPPWADAGAPKWLPMIQWLDYSGMETSSIEGRVGVAIPRAAHVTVEARGPGWFRVGVVDTAAASGDLPARRPSIVVSGPAQYLGYFIPPAAIAGLKAGVELDRDPTTGFVVRVGSETRVEGRDVVVIVGESAALRVEAAYDAVSGMRVHLSIDDRARRVLTHWKLGG